MIIRTENLDSGFAHWLKAEGMFEEANAAAIKRVVASQLRETMVKEHISETEMAKRMHTSRTSLGRLLDPDSDAVTLTTLFKAVSAIGRQIRVELI
jgi:antitoxin HicB